MTSRARDHLANERTMLSQLRSAIALVSFGVAAREGAGKLQRMLADDGGTMERWASALTDLVRVGSAAVLVGGTLLCWTSVQYALFARALAKGRRRARRPVVRMLAAVLVLALLLAIVATGTAPR